MDSDELNLNYKTKHHHIGQSAGSMVTLRAHLSISSMAPLNDEEQAGAALSLFFLPTGVGPSASLSSLVSTAEATWSNGNRSYQNKSTVKLIVVVLTFELNWWINPFILLHSEPNTTGQGQVKGRLNVRLKMLIQCSIYFIAWLTAFALFLYSKLVCWNVLQTERSGCKRKKRHTSLTDQKTQIHQLYTVVSLYRGSPFVPLVHCRFYFSYSHLARVSLYCGILR